MQVRQRKRKKSVWVNWLEIYMKTISVSISTITGGWWYLMWLETGRNVKLNLSINVHSVWFDLLKVTILSICFGVFQSSISIPGCLVVFADYIVC